MAMQPLHRQPLLGCIRRGNSYITFGAPPFGMCKVRCNVQSVQCIECAVRRVCTAQCAGCTVYSVNCAMCLVVQCAMFGVYSMHYAKMDIVYVV